MTLGLLYKSFLKVSLETFLGATKSCILSADNAHVCIVGGNKILRVGPHFSADLVPGRNSPGDSACIGPEITSL